MNFQPCASDLIDYNVSVNHISNEGVSNPLYLFTKELNLSTIWEQGTCMVSASLLKDEFINVQNYTLRATFVANQSLVPEFYEEFVINPIFSNITGNSENEDNAEKEKIIPQAIQDNFLLIGAGMISVIVLKISKLSLKRRGDIRFNSDKS